MLMHRSKSWPETRAYIEMLPVIYISLNYISLNPLLSHCCTLCVSSSQVFVGPHQCWQMSQICHFWTAERRRSAGLMMHRSAPGSKAMRSREGLGTHKKPWYHRLSPGSIFGGWIITFWFPKTWNSFVDYPQDALGHVAQLQTSNPGKWSGKRVLRSVLLLI